MGLTISNFTLKERLSTELWFFILVEVAYKSFMYAGYFMLIHEIRDYFTCQVPVHGGRGGE